MANVKVKDNPVDSLESLYNLCQYITGDAESIKRHFSYGRGVDPNNVFEEFKNMQELFGRKGKRLAFHLTIDFDEENYLEVKDAVTVGYELSDLFFPGHQLIFSVHGKHTGQENLQLHFLINTVSIFGKEDLYINFDILNYIRQCLDWVLKNCI